MQYRQLTLPVCPYTNYRAKCAQTKDSPGRLLRTASLFGTPTRLLVGVLISPENCNMVDSLKPDVNTATLSPASIVSLPAKSAPAAEVAKIEAGVAAARATIVADISVGEAKVKTFAAELAAWAKEYRIALIAGGVAILLYVIRHL
jgi:hypothetical protein